MPDDFTCQRKVESAATHWINFLKLTQVSRKHNVTASV
jgi:hypothetical protein